MMKRIFIAACVAVCSMFLSQCEKSESAYKFEIISAGAPCTGYYSVNGEKKKALDVTTLMEGSSYYYDYEKELESPSTVLIHVNSIALNVASSITVYIYLNDDLVENQTFTPVSSSTTTGTIWSISGEVTHSFDGSATAD